MDIVGALLLLTFFKISFVYPIFILGIIIGIIDVMSAFTYYKAMLIEEASRVIPLSYMNALFTPILAFFIFGEDIGIQKYIGVLFLAIGAMMISYKKIKKSKWKFSPAIKLILVIAFLWSIINIMDKYSLNFIDSISLFFWTVIGFSIGGLSTLYFSNVRKDFIKVTHNMNKKYFLLAIVGVFFAYCAFISFLTAISMGYVSLVVGVASIQPFIVFVYATILTLFFPNIIKERIDKSTILLKVIAIILMITGTFLATI
jgi:drug/metabolite transporter (DMT)-like permease